MIRLLWLIFLSFLKVGLFGYGGGPSMIPLVQQEVVSLNQWLEPSEFADALAMGNALPGPIAIKMSAYVGYRVGTKYTGSRLVGVLGSLLALLGTNLPALVLMGILSLVYLRIKDNPKVTAALKGARPAVVGLLLWTAYDLGKPLLFRGGQVTWTGLLKSWDLFLLAGVAFVLVTFLKVHPALVILGAAVVGFLVY